MIKKLKIKFVCLTMMSLLALLTLIVTTMNTVNYGSVVREADEKLQLISENRGVLPEGVRIPFGYQWMDSSETAFESRYFSVLIDKDNTLIEVDMRHIASVGVDDAIDYANAVLAKGKSKGFIGIYRYAVTQDGANTRISLMDCRKSLVSYFTFFYTSINVAIIGFILVFAVVVILAGKIIKPFAENYEKQKQFITDAGHEIKTPLTIINANADLLEMELGEDNESIADIKQQTERLKEMTNDLIMLSRMGESKPDVTKVDFPLSDVVSEAVTPFRGIAQSQNKNLQLDIQPMLTLNGDQKAIERLISLLADNAMKYSPDGGEVTISLAQQGKSIILTVFNTTVAEVDPKKLDKVFERFYRTEESRNSETGGHGIGLSVAKAIVLAHGGKISASAPSQYAFKITAIFPAKTK